MEMAMKYPTSQKLGAWSMIMTLMLGMFVSVGIVQTTACTSNQVENNINAVLSAAQAVIKVAEPNASWVPQMSAAITALQQAETAWKGGSSITIVESALNTLASVTSVIPITATYSPLIDIIVAAVDMVLNTIQVNNPSVSVKAAVVLGPYNHHGRVVLAKPGLFHRSQASAIKAQWNKAVKANPALAAAKL
jgi:hypothetical protein